MSNLNILTRTKKAAYFLFIALVMLFISSCDKINNKQNKSAKSKFEVDKLTQNQIDSLYSDGMIARRCFKSITNKYTFIKSTFISKEEVIDNDSDYEMGFLYDSLNNVLIVSSQLNFGYEQKSYVFFLSQKTIHEIDGITLKCFVLEKNILLEKDVNENDGAGRKFAYSIIDYYGNKIFEIGNCNE